MDQPDREIWDGVLAHLRRYHPTLCRQWFEQIEPLGVAEGSLHLRTGTPVQGDYLRRRCLDEFNDALRTVTGRLMTVRFLDRDEPAPRMDPPGRSRRAAEGAHRDARATEPARAERVHAGKADGFVEARPMGRDAAHDDRPSDPEPDLPGVREAMRENGVAEPAPSRPSPTRSRDPSATSESRRVMPRISDDSLVINPDYAFEHFVVGPGNRLAHAAAVAVADNPGKAYNPLFIHGGVGLGKTHLLQAICLRIAEHTPDTVMAYLSCDGFVNQFMESVQAGEMAEFRHRFREVDLLVIDDIHFLAKRERTQEEFFHTFNSLFQANKQIVLSSDAPPHEIPDLEDRLISRFAWGLVSDVEPPCFDTRVAILRTKARIRGFELPDEAACFIAERIDSNIRELEGAIGRVQIRAMVENRDVDLDLVRDALGIVEDAPSLGPSIQGIIETVTRFYSVKLTELQSRKRSRSIALPRQVCMYLARRMTRLSLEEVGGYFGGRDHSTVLHAVRTISDRRDADPEFARTLVALEEQCAGRRTEASG
ncbi:MAG: chromosomal replication initiator protein DnaA [Planctomycetota bacterium]